MKIARSVVVSLIVTLGVIVGSVGLVVPVSAGIHLNTIDDPATLRGNGHEVVVTGPIACDVGENVEIDIVVTQGSTIATGSFHARCDGAAVAQQWTVHASTPKGTTLTAGTARIDAAAVTTVKHIPTEPLPHTWWKNVTLISK